MFETRLVERGTARSQLKGLAPAVLLLLAAALILPAAAAQPAAPADTGEPAARTGAADEPAAQTGAADEPATQTDTAEKAAQESDPLHATGDAEGKCDPPSTRDWVLISVGALGILALCFFLLVRVVQRYFIHREWSATLGRHSGISLTFLLGSLGMIGLAYLVTGCIHRQFLVWLCFPLALWLIHGSYTLFVVRSE